MRELVFALVIVAALMAFFDWRKGLFLCVVTAFFQDPMRKMVLGEPVYFVLLVGVVFGAAMMGAFRQKIRLVPSVIHGWQSQVGTPFLLFLVLVSVQALHSLLRFGSPVMTAIGLLFYLVPIPAIVFAYQFAVRANLERIRHWIWVYVVAGMVALSGIYLEYVGFGWRSLGEVGEGILIYDVGTVLKAYSGFLRSSEMAAWHIAAISCFLFILMIGRKFTMSRIFLVAAVVAVLLSLGMLTGRRKMLVVVMVFVSMYFFLYAWFQLHTTKPALFAVAVGVLAYILVVGVITPEAEISDTKHLRIDSAERFEHYKVRGASVFGDIAQRFDKLGIQPVMWAVDRYGFFGAGLGTGSQGVQHLAVSGGISRGAAEGGLGKITMELGIPGLFLIVWLLVAFAKYVRKALEVTAKASLRHARMAYGLLAFLVANAAAFSVATQAFGDLFVLLILGWSVGFLLAMPVLAHRAAQLPPQQSMAWARRSGAVASVP